MGQVMNPYIVAVKRHVGQTVPYLGHFLTYIEPFRSSLHIALSGANRIELLNDTDRSIISFWQVYRDRRPDLMDTIHSGHVAAKDIAMIKAVHVVRTVYDEICGPEHNPHRLLDMVCNRLRQIVLEYMKPSDMLYRCSMCQIPKDVRDKTALNKSVIMCDLVQPMIRHRKNTRWHKAVSSSIIKSFVPVLVLGWESQYWSGRLARAGFEQYSVGETIQKDHRLDPPSGGRHLVLWYRTPPAANIFGFYSGI